MDAKWAKQKKEPCGSIQKRLHHMISTNTGVISTTATLKICLSLLTFLPMEEVRRLSSLQDAEINEAKKVLAYEVTKLVHGEAEAEKAQQAAEALFGGGGALTDVPTIEITAADAEGKIIDVLTAGKIFSSKREARQMIQQGGLYIGENTVSNPEASFAPSMFDAEKSLLIRKGKKKYFRLIIQ